MKKLMVFIMLLGLCGTVQADLIGQWKLDGDMTDSVGSNDGTAVNGPITYVAGAPKGTDPGRPSLLGVVLISV